jgi:hypothetical protein
VLSTLDKESNLETEPSHTLGGSGEGRVQGKREVESV